jgi:hypothetical protein
MARPTTKVVYPSGFAVVFILDRRTGYPTREAYDAAVAAQVATARKLTGQEPKVEVLA